MTRVSARTPSCSIASAAPGVCIAAMVRQDQFDGKRRRIARTFARQGSGQRRLGIRTRSPDVAREMGVAAAEQGGAPSRRPVGTQICKSAVDQPVQIWSRTHRRRSLRHRHATGSQACRLSVSDAQKRSADSCLAIVSMHAVEHDRRRGGRARAWTELTFQSPSPRLTAFAMDGRCDACGARSRACPIDSERRLHFATSNKCRPPR